MTSRIGGYRHRVRLQRAGDPVPDGDGGWTNAPVPLDPPEWDARITPAALRDLERFAAGTITAMATHIVEGRYRPDVTIQTQVVYHDVQQARDRVLAVVGVVNPDMRDWLLVLLCAEHVD